MARVLPKTVENVIKAFEKLPGIGPKSAARMAYHFLSAPEEMSMDLAKSLVKMKRSIVTCSKCFNVSDSDPCVICEDSGRDNTRICVVESPLDVVAIEKSGVFNGIYHVLGGVISPADGIGPEHIRTRELKNRLSFKGDNGERRGDIGEEILEVIVATNPSLEGEATSAYIAEMVKKLNKVNDLDIEISRLAMGLPTGADLEYADRLTLKRALEGRTKM
jgi:recombination protein RecR